MPADCEEDVVAEIPRVLGRRAGARAALIFGERTTTFAELDRHVDQVARALIGEGVAPGDRVAVLDRDSDEHVEALFGIARAGGVAVGINWRLAPPEVTWILEDSGARVLLVGAPLLVRIGPELAKLPRPPRIIVFGEATAGDGGFASWRDAQLPGGSFPPDDPGRVVAQLYTSGTTGRPKGVMLANRSFFAVVRNLREAGDPWIGWSPSDVFATGLPLFHVGGIWFTMTGLQHGATLVVMDSFVAWKTLELIQRHRITKICLVPAMIGVCLDEPGARSADLSSLGCIVYGGSPIPLPVLERAIARLRCGFAQIYGLTETGNTAVCLRPEDHRGGPAARLQAAGRPYPGVELRIIDDSGRPLPPREVGEICIKSPANMVGYWRNPAATEKTLIDGWIHTGDAGWLDEEGYVFVSDRLKDMIIAGGENIFPAEVESVLAGHPAVAEVAVIGIPDERWGEQVKAVVVRRPGASLTPNELIGFAKGRLAEFKIPRSVDFVEALPRTPSGKLKKAELREPWWRGRSRRI